MSPKRQAGKLQQGFSLIEMMVVVLILGVVSAGIFLQIDTA
jgi:prepilin-type N-terminal cleavage/methylation domain-containing protein